MQDEMGKKALFLDRDGIINEDSAYPYKPEHIVFCDGIFELCKKAIEKGYILIVVTNQAGVAKGYFSEQDVEALHSWIKNEFKIRGIEITAFYFSPYHPQGTVERYKKETDCRKPGPGMILQAVKEYDIDLSVSLMLGDKDSDRINIDGLKSLIVKSKYVKSGYDIETLSLAELHLN
jgi:D-glycero-D-manno-heptose 1,7-bisphosphate phosphatase